MGWSTWQPCNKAILLIIQQVKAWNDQSLFEKTAVGQRNISCCCRIACRAWRRDGVWKHLPVWNHLWSVSSVQSLDSVCKPVLTSLPTVGVATAVPAVPAVPAASFIQQQAQAVPATQTSVSGSLGGGRLGGDSWVGRRVRGSPCGKTFSAECQASLCALQVAVLIFAFNFFSFHVRLWDPEFSCGALSEEGIFPYLGGLVCVVSS